jgi:hypothetical protein
LLNNPVTLGPTFAVGVDANQRRAVGEAKRQRIVRIVVTTFWAEEHYLNNLRSHPNNEKAAQ